MKPQRGLFLILKLQLIKRNQIAWFEFWLPILSGLGQQCYHPCKEIRHASIGLLQKSLFTPELVGEEMNDTNETLA